MSKIRTRIASKVGRTSKSEHHTPTLLTRSYNDRQVIRTIHKLPFSVLLVVAILLAGLIGYGVINDRGNSSALAGVLAPIPVTCTQTITTGSISTAANALSAGQTLCLSGTFNQGVTITKAGVTVASKPGETARINGQMIIRGNAVRVIGLYLDGIGTIVSPIVSADNVTFQGNSITNQPPAGKTRGICLQIGETEINKEVMGVTIDGNRIFRCGTVYHDQGIYAEFVRNAVIRNNYIYDNPDFGIQFYPSAQDSIFEYNVLDNNKRGLTYSSEGLSINKSSNRNIVRYNIITNSADAYNLNYYWGGPVGTGNRAENNCLFNGGRGNIQPNLTQYVTVTGTITADPMYVDRANKDFRLKTGSPCANMGPRTASISNPTPTPTPAPTPTATVIPETIVTNVDTPWGMQFAPDGKLYFTERKGTVRVYMNGQLRSTPVLTISGTETLSAEEGLQGLALHPNFASNGWMYLYYTYTDSAGAMKNRVARYVINTSTATVTSGPVTIVDGIPGYRFHNGGRIKFGPDNKLYIATGAATPDTISQDRNNLGGKILRVNDDGSAAAGNPFGNRIYSLGHRNPQGLAWHPTTGELWSTEHGPSSSAPYCCNDEVNKIVAGANYGWPRYYGMSGEDSRYTSFTFTHTKPVWTSGTSSKWAPGGAMFYSGTQLGSPWTNSLIFAGLGGIDGSNRALFRLRMSSDGRTPVAIDTLYKNSYGRIRDVIQGPDGAIYIATSNRDGRGSPISTDDRIIRLKPDTAAPTPTPTPTPSAPVVTLSANPASIQSGSASTLSWSATNSPSSCTASGDWTGTKSASGSQSTGALTTARTYSYTLTCTNAGGSGSRTATVVVSAAAPNPTPTPTPTPGQSPYNGANQRVPGVIQAEHYDLGGQGVAYSDKEPQNYGGQLRTDGVDVESNKVGGYNVGWVSSGEWLEFTTTVTGGTYDVTFRVATAATTSTGSWILKNGSTTLATATTGNTGGWYTFKNITIKGVQITGGTTVLRLEALNAALNLDYVQFTPPSTSTPTPTPTPSATQIVEAENATSCIIGRTARTCASGVWSWSTSGASGGKFVALTSTNDSLTHRFTVPSDGYYKVGFQMRGQSYRGSALVDAYIDGVRIAAGSTISDTFSYRYMNKYLTAGTHSAKIVFVNDKCGNYVPYESCSGSYDRNLWIDQFRLYPQL